LRVTADLKFLDNFSNTSLQEIWSESPKGFYSEISCEKSIENLSSKEEKKESSNENKIQDHFISLILSAPHSLKTFASI